MWPDWRAEHVVLRRTTWRDVAPFVGVGLLGLVTLLAPPYSDASVLEVVLLLATFVAMLAVLAHGFRRPARGWTARVAPALAFVAIALARDVGGGSSSGLGTLVVLPILWIALTGSVQDLLLGAAYTIALFGLPVLLVGGPGYPADDWRRGLVWVAVAVVIAPGIQAMVQEVARGTVAVAAEEARWRALAEHLPDVTVLVVDEDLRVRQVGGAGVAEHGLRPRVGMTLEELYPAADLDVLQPLLRSAFQGRTGTAELRSPDDGELVVTVSPLPPEEDSRRALVLARDVRVERERERALVRATARTERLFADAPHGVMVLGMDGTVVRVNTALRRIIGVEPGRLEGEHVSVLAPPDDRTLHAHLAEVLAADGERAVHTDAVIRDVRDEDVHVALSGLVLRDEPGDGGSREDVVIVNVVDVSERRRYEDRLAHLADHDVLTGLANRRRFDAELHRHLEQCRRYGPTGALLVLDLDNFKQVNDTLGHEAGDQLIVSTAGLLRRGVRSTDVVARLGGDEFAVLLTEVDQASAEKVAQAIVDRVRDYTATLDGVRRRVTVSVGVVTFQAAQRHSMDVFALADMTMYDAKDAGRGRYAVLEEGSSAPPRTGARLQWQARIEQALETDGFALLYQPIQDLHTGEVAAAEVLLRLADGDHLVPPSRFLYIAERAGLMPEIDAWVVRHSVARLARLRELHPRFQLDVNLSGHSIGNPRIEQAVVRALEEHRIDPSALILEITETAAVSDVGLARDFARRMTDLGCQFALDDFGAGFGSFYYLKHLMFDFVKIDGEFVSAAPHSGVDRTILRSVVGIARDLGKRTIAEFVSDQEILDVVRAEGVDQAQGYLVGAPVPFDEFVAVHLDATPPSSAG